MASLFAPTANTLDDEAGDLVAQLYRFPGTWFAGNERNIQLTPGVVATFLSTMKWTPDTFKAALAAYPHEIPTNICLRLPGERAPTIASRHGRFDTLVHIRQTAALNSQGEPDYYLLILQTGVNRAFVYGSTEESREDVEDMRSHLAAITGTSDKPFFIWSQEERPLYGEDLAQYGPYWFCLAMKAVFRPRAHEELPLSYGPNLRVQIAVMVKEALDKTERGEFIQRHFDRSSREASWDDDAGPSPWEPGSINRSSSNARVAW